MIYFFISLILIAAVAASYLIFRIRIHRNDVRKAKTKHNQWEEDGISWYEESGSIDPETFDRLKTKNRL